MLANEKVSLAVTMKKLKLLNCRFVDARNLK